MPTIQEVQYKQVSHTSLKENYEEAKKDASFHALVKKLSLTDEEAMKITSKLQDTIEGLKHCKDCKGLNHCKNSYVGHVLFPQKISGKMYFSYRACKFQESFSRAKKLKEEQSNSYRFARMKDIDMTGDKKRIAVIKWIDQFFQSYHYEKEMKGLYLHGNFGSGKTFLLHALFHELECEKFVQTEIVYVPEVLRVLRDDWELYESKMKRYQTVDLLLLDDIGAEKVSEWGRDEVLGAILQYRMNHQLPTFFTSNMTLQELESHLARINGVLDTVKAKRIIERIKQLSIPMELVSENRRK